MSILSEFADFCFNNFMKYKGNILNINSNNLSDIIFFKQNNFKITCIDSCHKIIEINKKLYNDIDFYQYTLNKLSELNINDKYIYIYSKLNYSIDEIDFNDYLDFIKINLLNNGKILIECKNTLNLQSVIDLIYNKKYSIEYINEINIESQNLLRIIIQNNDLIPKPNIYFLKIRDKLIEFVKLCNINNLKIIAHSGNLLGAVRCNGLIPWDTDIDIGILNEDVSKLLNLLKNEYYISSCKKIDNEYQNYLITDSNIINNFDLINNLIWIHKDNLYIQLNIMSEDKFFKPEKWSKTEYKDDNYIIQINNNLKYEDGGRNIPEKLFYPLKKIKFYNTEIYIPNQSEIILKNWYGENCLTHYPNNYNSHMDINRFITSNKIIEYFYGI
jgi:phosphorylcholine metabolism protein LicD